MSCTYEQVSELLQVKPASQESMAFVLQCPIELRCHYFLIKLSRYATSLGLPTNNGTLWCTFSGQMSRTRSWPVDPVPPACMTSTAYLRMPSMLHAQQYMALHINLVFLVQQLLRQRRNLELFVSAAKSWHCSDMPVSLCSMHRKKVDLPQL